MSDVETDLGGLRDQIDELDGELVALLGQRFAVTRQIGALKASADLPSRDVARESHQRLRLALLADGQNIDSAMVLRIFDEIVCQVIDEHDAMKE